MSLLDKIADKARNTKGAMKYPALILSSIADYVAGTNNEMKEHKSNLQEEMAEGTAGKVDYHLYDKTTALGCVGEGYAAVIAVQRNLPVPRYVLGVDLAVRFSNLLGGLKRSVKDDESESTDVNFAGVIGTARAIGYRIAGKLKRGEGDAGAEAEDEDPFEDDAFQIPSAYSADAEDDDDGPDFGMSDDDDSGNELF